MPAPHDLVPVGIGALRETAFERARTLEGFGYRSDRVGRATVREGTRRGKRADRDSSDGHEAQDYQCQRTS